jgi:hypothetical protein
MLTLNFRTAGRKMLASRVSLAAIGSLKRLPSYSDIELGLLDKEVRTKQEIVLKFLGNFKGTVSRDGG